MDPESDGVRLDRFLSLRIRRLSRARAARLEVIDLDDPGRALKKSSPVRAGQRLWARRPSPDAGVRFDAPEVLAEDGDLLVLDKPAGLAVHPTAARFEATVTRWLARHHPGAEPVHRLDVETSGVLVCARHAMAHRALKQAFAERAVHKTYRAVVVGLPTDDAYVVDTPLGFDGQSAVRLKMGVGDLPAETAFRVVRRGHQRALVTCEPHTGRQHQIRAHAALAGHPLVGDKLYGPDERIFLAHLDGAVTPAQWDALGHTRHALHAVSVAFEWRGQARSFTSPWPAELDALVI